MSNCKMLKFVLFIKKTKLVAPRILLFLFSLVIIDTSADRYNNIQEGRGHWAVYYTSPQSFIITFFLFIGYTTLGTLSESFDWLIHEVECLNVSITNFNLQRG